eukprot:5336604-Pyramimonas_sp.AAC.1
MVVGDFNVAESPPKSLNAPVDSDTTAAQRCQCRPVFRRSLFRDMIEITSSSTTHRAEGNMSESTTDRCFINLP